MGTLGRKESKMEGAEPGTARWAEESRKRKVCKLAAGVQMENARCGLRKVCGVSKREYNGVQDDGDGRLARHRPPPFQ